jgi:hypothetical protein
MKQLKKQRDDDLIIEYYQVFGWSHYRLTGTQGVEIPEMGKSTPESKPAKKK